MVASFSPHRDAGGTLHLPSPTGIHHVHPSSAIHQLRRSLSRSPSKGSLLSRPNSPSAKHSHYISSPLSPSRRASQGNLFLVPTSSGSSPLAVPYPPSARMNRPNLRRNGAWQSNRPRTTPSSPAKRVLSDSRDQGNSVPLPNNDSSTVDGKQPSEGTSTTPTKDPPSSSKPLFNDMAGNSPAPKAPSRIIEKRGSANFGPFSTTSSPLKRSDGIMNLDQASQGSPSAKRRSLHGANFGPDFDVFDLANAGTSTMEPSSTNQSQSDHQVSSFPPSSPHFSSIPKRSSSLRKSTLQQRQPDRSIFSRPRPNVDQSVESPPVSPMVLRSRQRMSLDSHMSLASSREQQTTSQGIFSTPSGPLFSQTNDAPQPRHAAHPLSRTITQSSSGSSLADDSPTHEPIHVNFDRPRPVLNFSKSLPAGSTRPLGPSQLRQANSNESSDSPFATPNNYKLVKPLPAAFMSTGLISKKNRNVEDIHNASIGGKNMPDTPCKRPTNMLPPVQKPSQNTTSTKPRPTPQPSGPFATPFSRPEASSKPTPFSKGMGIFGSSLQNKATSGRRGSFVSIDGDTSVQSQSPSGNHDSQSTIESELPPTPTKQALPSRTGGFSGSQQQQPRSSLDNVQNYSGPCCKLPPIESSPPISPDEDSDCSMDDSPSAGPSHKAIQPISPVFTSLPRSRLLTNLNSPSPLSNSYFPDFQQHSLRYSEIGHAKNNPTSAASPLGSRSLRRSSPHTPQDHIFPPDPSGLSISVHCDQSADQQDLNSSVLPATPTAPREYYAQIGKRQSFQLSGYSAPDVDPCLTSRFEKVELVGTGEFSQVYRVSQSQTPSTSQTPFAKKHSPSSHRLEKVWAVKKSKQPFSGVRDRQRRKREVEILRALSGSDYVISYADSWEDNSHLYIQTEFCEEGSLDVFLSQVGLKARLDDFRIWKILLELSLGLKHIHDSGYIHLDLKPANILITFEGVLKIADFGMATSWPAAAGIEGEGDREYIGPEILMGRYDKPADVFALGLIIFEIAGNVELPDNGVSWQKLRNGDMSDVPSLTWSCETSNILRDASGNPLGEHGSFEQLFGSDSGEEFSRPDIDVGAKNILDRDGRLPHLARSGELAEPPSFMVDAGNDDALDKIVRWMISPDPADRPVADQVVHTYGVQWVERRRRAGATIFEGNWGPADEVIAEDAEMIDV